MRQLGINTPVAALVGFGQSRAPDWGMEPNGVELGGLCAETGLDVAQTLAISQLGEGRGQLVIPAGTAFCVAASAVTGHAFLKLPVGQMLDHLRKDRSAGVHSALLLCPEAEAKRRKSRSDFKSFSERPKSINYVISVLR